MGAPPPGMHRSGGVAGQGAHGPRHGGATPSVPPGGNGRRDPARGAQPARTPSPLSRRRPGRPGRAAEQIGGAGRVPPAVRRALGAPEEGVESRLLPRQAPEVERRRGRHAAPGRPAKPCTVGQVETGETPGAVPGTRDTPPLPRRRGRARATLCRSGTRGPRLSRNSSRSMTSSHGTGRRMGRIAGAMRRLAPLPSE